MSASDSPNEPSQNVAAAVAIAGAIGQLETGDVMSDAHRLLAAVVDNVPANIFVKDREGFYLLANRALGELFNKPCSEILGRHDNELFSAEVGEQVRARDVAIMEGGQPVQYEETLSTPRGARSYLTIKFPIYDAHGKLSGLCGIATDITEQKQAEAERTALQEKVIAIQDAALRELSTPLIPVADGILVMPLVGAIDSLRAHRIMEMLLEGVGTQRAHTAILDITGVREVDAQVAGALVQSASAARLLGARVVLTGMSPEVARTFVELGADLQGIATRSTLQSGIAFGLLR